MRFRKRRFPSVEILRVQKGDMIVLEATGRLSEAQVAQIKDQWQRAMGDDPDVKVVVVDGLRPKVLRKSSVR